MARTSARTRSKNQNQNPNQVSNNVLGEIREKAESLAVERMEKRLINRQQSPSKRTAANQKRKAKRNSLKMEQLLLHTKENLSKVNKFNIYFLNIGCWKIILFIINRLPIGVYQISHRNQKVFLTKSMIRS